MKLRWLAIIAVAVLLVVVLLFCGLRAAFPARGQLVDQDGKLMPNAWVVATRSECRGLGHCSTSCVEVKVAKTDDHGQYSFRSGLRSLTAYQLVAYREGYHVSYRQGDPPFLARGGQDRRFSLMKPVDARIAYLTKTANEISCFTGPAQQRAALLPVYKAMFREAESLARYPEQHKKARQICEEMFLIRVRSPVPVPTERAKGQYLQDIEPACNAPIDDRKEMDILAAIQRGDAEPLRRAGRERFDFNRLLDGRNPPIITAAAADRADMIEELAALGAKADAVGEDNRTALEQVVLDFQGRVNAAIVLKALLEAGADPNRPDTAGYPPLLRVSRADNTQLFDLLLEHGARADQEVTCADCGERGQTVLHVTTNATLALRAIQHGANVNARTSWGSTPLMHAQRPEVVKVLLENGADPNLSTGDRWTPLMYALRNYESFHNSADAQPQREIAEMLVTSGARLDSRNQHGLDAFYYTQDDALKERLRVLAQQHQPAY